MNDASRCGLRLGFLGPGVFTSVSLSTPFTGTVAACSFESMRANWHKLDPRLYAPGQEPGFRFVREGRVGAGKAALSPASRELLRRATAKVPR